MHRLEAVQASDAPNFHMCTLINFDGCY